MKKLNLKSFFKKVNSSTALNRLVDSINDKLKVADNEDTTPHFPTIDKVEDPKDRAKTLMSHLELLSPENKISLIEDLKKINNFANKETIKIVKILLQNKTKYTFSTGDESYIIASEDDIDLIINIYIAKSDILDEADIISSFYKKKNWTHYEALSKDIINNESDNELLAIELGLALKETLNNDTEIVEHDFKIFEYDNINFLFIKNDKDEKENICLAFIKDINMIMISGRGDKEKLFTIAECYARMVFSIDIDPKVLAYDLSQFKIKDVSSKSGNENLYPLNNSNNLKNWKIKNVELTNIISRDVLIIKLKTNLEHNGMTQMWSFLESLGQIKDLMGYEMKKLSIIIEINNSNSEKGFEKINLNINEKTSNLNMLYPSHRIIYQILKDAEICLGFVEKE